jgi:hypothetical protein
MSSGRRFATQISIQNTPLTPQKTDAIDVLCGNVEQAP